MATGFPVYLLGLLPSFLKGVLRPGCKTFVSFRSPTYRAAPTHLKYRRLTALNDRSAWHKSLMISSHMPFERPYTLSGCTGLVSGIGIVSGVPYTVADDE